MRNISCRHQNRTFLLVTLMSFLILMLITFWPSTHFGNSLYFGDDLSLTTSTNPLSFMEGSLAATEKGNVFVVWVEGSSVYLRTSQDYGVKFGNPVLLSKVSNVNVSSSSPQTGPKIAATEKGNVLVVWVEGNSVYLRSSQDYGVKFGDPILLSNEARIASSPQISATESGNVYVVWADKNTMSGDIDIILKRSTDDSMEFGNGDRLSRKNDILSLSPQIIGTERGNVYFVRADKNNMTGESEIIFRSSSNNGEDFDRNTPLDKDPGDFTVSVSPEIAGTERGDAYVVWIEENVQFKEILDNGTWFSETVTINNMSSLGFFPQVTATERGDVFLIWVNQINGTSTKDLLFKRISHSFLE